MFASFVHHRSKPADLRIIYEKPIRTQGPDPHKTIKNPFKIDTKNTFEKNIEKSVHEIDFGIEFAFPKSLKIYKKSEIFSRIWTTFVYTLLLNP